MTTFTSEDRMAAQKQMNANELADELADYLQNKAEVELNPKLQKSATMLRQQQAEIKELKAELKMTQYTVSAWQKWKTDLEEFIK